MRKTIKSKIAWLTVLALTMIVLSFTAFVYVYLAKWMVSQEMQAASLRAAQIAHTYQSHLDEGAGQRTVLTPSWLSRLVHGQELALVYDAHGRLVEHAGKLSVPGGQKQLAAMHNAMLLIGGRHYARVIIRAHYENDRLLGTIVYYSSLSVAYHYLQELIQTLVVGAAGAIALSWFSGYWLSSVALRPIGRMIQAVTHIDATRVTERLPVSAARDEISLLAETFNRLLGRIQSAMDQQNRFVADASHELRTPLTVLLGYTDLLERWGQEDPAAVAKAVSAMKKQIRQLRRLTNELLQLASFHELSPPQAALDIRTAVEEAVEHIAVGYDRDIQTAVPDKPVFAAVYPEHLQQILFILLHNAATHTERDVPIRVEAGVLDRIVFVSVADAGQGIAPEHLEHIFERFYRVDKARSRGTGGTGLGLAIAKELAAAYGGSIEATSRLGSGTVMTVRWPVADA
ncbi:MAG: sensor histidine kinase [Bacilli bacterium]